MFPRSRVIFRLSGTGSSGATIRVYLEHYTKTDLDKDVQKILEPLVVFAGEVGDIVGITGRATPTVIT